MLRELFLGFIRMHILFHAAERPVYGIELMEELGGSMVKQLWSGNWTAD